MTHLYWIKLNISIQTLELVKSFIQISFHLFTLQSYMICSSLAKIVANKMEKCISTGLLLTLSLIFAYSHAAKVEFYEKEDYQGAKYETTSTPSCTNLPSYFTKVNGSIRTDGCIMGFWKTDCAKDSVRIKPERRSLHYEFYNYIHDDSDPNPSFCVRSFRDCNVLESDTKINVDIYNQPSYKGDKIQFRDMCTCQNLPRSTRGKKLSTNNHGNCFIAYMESDCKGKEKQIKGGQHDDSVLIQTRIHWCAEKNPITQVIQCGSRPTADFQSIAPCGDLPQHCLGLNAVIYSIVPVEDFTLDPNTVKAFAMTGSGTFRNTGPNTMTERYSAELEVAETKQFEFSESLRSLTSVKLEAGYKTTTKGGAPGIAEVAVEIDLRASLSTEIETGNTKTETSSTQKTKRFSVSKDIEIAPCTEQEVHSFVEVASDVEMNYRVLFKVTGSIQNQTRLNATEVRERLKQFTFVRDEDEYTVIAETTAKFKTTFGIKTNTNSTGRRIPDCAFYSSSTRLFHNAAVFMHFLLFCTLQLIVTKL